MARNKIPIDPLSERLLIELQAAIAARFKSSLEGKVAIEDVIDSCEEIISDLPLIKEHVAPCFPPYYSVFEFCKEEYLQRIEKGIDPFIPRSESHALKDPGMLVVLASWLDNYEILLGKLGIDQQEDQLLSMKMVNLNI